MVLAEQPEPQAVCNPLPPALRLGVSKSVTGPLRAESWFLTALWEALLVFKPAQGTPLPVSDLSAGVPNMDLPPITPQGGALGL